MECKDVRPSPVSQSANPNARKVQCVKFGREMEGLDTPPFKGDLGQRLYENVSKEAWKMWLEQQKMLINEYRLSPMDPEARKFLKEQTEAFFFGEGAKLPEGYVPPAQGRK